MSNDRSELDELLWIELRHGLTKRVGDNIDTDTVDNIERDLTNLLNKYKGLLSIEGPLPRIKMWLSNDKLNFMFFDRKTGKRMLLGQWLENKGGLYEQ